MRRTAGLAALAVAAATAAALPLTTASTAQGAPAAVRADVVSDALAALQRHPGAARSTDGQAFVAGTTLVDPDGSTHVRFDRTLDGLRVVGGDLVVHRDASGGWDGVSQTVAAPLTVGTDARDREDRGHADRPGPQRAAPPPSAATTAPRRVSSSSTPPGPRRASRGRSSPAAPRPTAPPRAWRRTSTHAPAW